MVDDKEGLRFLTPTTEDGPLYPPEPIPRRADLTNGGKAKGELLILMGVIYNHRRSPVSGAVVVDKHWEIGREDLDPNFSYFGSVETDSNGIYWFHTIIPRSYPVLGIDRAAHIHMKIWSKMNGVLTTELYFPGNEHKSRRDVDKVYQGRHQKSDLIVNFTSYNENMLDGVPELDSAKYCRRDIFFL